jgi:DNA-binding transcriptional ArsR family regulator
MDLLSIRFQALADPTRRAILAKLTLGEFSVNELVEPFAMSQPAISKHLKVLERAGLVSRGREAQFRPCRLEPEALQSCDQWLADYRRLWNDRLDRLETVLAQAQGARHSAKTKSAKPRKRRKP